MQNCSQTDVILIDAYSQIFRVFFAIAHLSRRDGFPTNALYGFCRLLLQLEKEFQPRQGAMFFDCGKPAFRLEILPDYKAGRPPMPEDLKKQMAPLRELCGLFGWNILSCTDYEADDLIGAAVCSSSGNDSIAILSSDKDLSQLIRNNVRMLIPSKQSGLSDRDCAGVVEKFSVTPEQMVDYLSLLGDAVDAIEGVPGVGPKTAAAVLAQFSSLDDFFAAPEKLANVKLRAKLLDATERIRRNRKLVQLRCDWPLAQLGNLEDAMQKEAPDWQKIADFCQKYELRSILKELPEAEQLPETLDLFSAWKTPQKEEKIPASSHGKPETPDLFPDWNS